MRRLRFALIAAVLGSMAQTSDFSATVSPRPPSRAFDTEALTAAAIFAHGAYSSQTFYWCRAVGVLAAGAIAHTHHHASAVQWAVSVAPMMLPHLLEPEEEYASTFSQLKDSTPDALRHWKERQKWPDLLRAAFPRSRAAAQALLDRWLSQGQPSYFAVERMIRLPEEGGTLPAEALVLRRFVWERLLADSFGGPQRIVRYAQRPKEGQTRRQDVMHLPVLPYAYKAWQSWGHFVVIMRIPPSGTFTLGREWPTLPQFANRDVVAEIRNGFPTRVWCEDLAALRIFLPVMTRADKHSPYHVQEVHGGRLSSAAFSHLDDALVHADLDGYGTLNLAGGPPNIDGMFSKTRPAWFSIRDGRSGYERVIITVRHGLPWEAVFLETERQLYFQMLYDRDQRRFMTARYGRFTAEEVDHFDARHSVEQYRIGPARNIHLGTRRTAFLFDEALIGKFATVDGFANPSGKNAFITSAVVRENGRVLARMVAGLLYAAADADPTSFRLGPLLNAFYRLNEANTTPEGAPYGGIAIKRLSKNGNFKAAGYAVHLVHFPYALVAFRWGPAGAFIRLLFDAHNLPILDANGRSITLNVAQDVPKGWLKALGGRMSTASLALAKGWIKHLSVLQSKLEGGHISIDDVTAFLVKADDQWRGMKKTVPDVLMPSFLKLSHTIDSIDRLNIRTLYEGLAAVRETAQKYYERAYAIASHGMSRKRWDPWVEGIHLLRRGA